MMKPLAGTKIAVLVANGFEEQTFLAAQKMMLEMGATIRIISTNQGLVNGWDGASWGHNYAVDAPLNTALGVDYDAVIIPGGRRSIEKLKLTAHTRRFIGSFMASSKPVAVMGDSVQLMAMCEQISGRSVAGPESERAMCEQAGAIWMDSAQHMDGNMLTGTCDEQSMADYFSTMGDMFMHNAGELDKAA